MAHYAFLDQNNIVIEVIVGKDETDTTLDWEQHYSEVKGLVCKRTSYNTLGNVHVYGGTPFRKNYASIGYYYDQEKDAFIPPKPFNSWILNNNTCLWEAPITKPDDGKRYEWNENLINWEEVEF
jgi:hypothetical protein